MVYVGGRSIVISQGDTLVIRTPGDIVVIEHPGINTAVWAESYGTWRLVYYEGDNPPMTPRGRIVTRTPTLIVAEEA